MNSNFYNNLKLFLIKKKWDNSNVSTTQIENLEIKKNKVFPKTYKDFLELTGKHFYPIHNSTTGLGGSFEYLEEANQRAKANLKSFGLEHLITKDFWVVAEMDGSVYIHYIFFDEGDNPPVYGLDMEGYTQTDSQDEFFGKSANSFSEYIEGFIKDYDPKLDR